MVPRQASALEIVKVAEVVTGVLWWYRKLCLTECTFEVSRFSQRNMGVQRYLMVPRQASALESSVCWCVIAKSDGGSVQGRGRSNLCASRAAWPTPEEQKYDDQQVCEPSAGQSNRLTSRLDHFGKKIPPRRLRRPSTGVPRTRATTTPATLR